MRNILEVFVLSLALCCLRIQANHHQELNLNEEDHPPKASSTEIIFQNEPIHLRHQPYPHNIRHKRGPVSGSISQTANRRGFIGPITYSGGLGFSSPAGHEISRVTSVQPHISRQRSVRTQIGLVNTPTQRVTGWTQRGRSFHKGFRRPGVETNSAGLNYVHQNHARAFVSGIHTPGTSNRGTVGGNILLATGNGGETKYFGQRTKSQHQIGVEPVYNFEN